MEFLPQWLESIIGLAGLIIVMVILLTVALLGAAGEFIIDDADSLDPRQTG